jgi:hypothetical protein
MQAKKSGSAKETQKSPLSSGKRDLESAQGSGQDWELSVPLAAEPTMESQSARLTDSRVPAVQRQSLAKQIGRLQGNRHLSRLLSQQLNTAPSGPTGIQRRALGNVANQTLATIHFTREGLVPAQSTLQVEEELVMPPEHPGRFAGFNNRVEGYGQAWRHRDRVSAVVQDRDGKYHTLKTDFPGSGVVDSLQILPRQNDYSHLWWVNLPQVARGRDSATLSNSWTDRAGRAMTWYRSWKNRQVPQDFSCPHDGQHGANLNDVRSCLESEFAALLAEALSIGRSEVHVIPSAGRPSPTALANFNLEMSDAAARGGIARLPTDRTSAAPSSTLTIGPLAFESRSNIQVLGTAVHESTHVSHAELGLQWRERWRTARTRAPFRDWLEGQKRRGRLNQEQFDLIMDQTRGGDKPTTETISHLDGFMATYHQMPIDQTIYRFEQIDKGAEFWATAGHAIHASTMTRLAAYYRSLNAAYRRDFAAHARQKAANSRRPWRDFWQHVVRSVLS